MKNYIKLLRVKHYIKNLLIFLPVFFGGKLLNKHNLNSTLIGFIVFCLVSSLIYIMNDIGDIENDRNHPKKCTRPLASGAISLKSAKILMIILIILIVLIHIIYPPIINNNAVIIILIYLIINYMYTKKLKNIPILDITILALGFLLRVMYGSAINTIPVSEWMYLTILTFSFYLGLGKRRNEIVKVNNENETRNVLKFYTYQFLDKNMHMCLATTLVFYSLWTVSSGKYLVITIPLVIIICMKYSLIIEGDSYGDPVDVFVYGNVIVDSQCS